jgi:hypothetical protein
MLSALIKAQPRKDGTVLDPLAIVTTRKKEKAPAPKDFKNSKKQKKDGGVKEKKPRKNKVVPASDNEDDEADFSEFVPLDNVPTGHYDGYVDEDVEAECGILSSERDEDVYAKKESEWSEFVKEEEERYDEEYETSSATSHSVEGSLTSIDPDDYGVDSYDSLSIDGETLDQSDDDVFDLYSYKKKDPKQTKTKTFSGIAIFEDTDWTP